MKGTAMIIWDPLRVNNVSDKDHVIWVNPEVQGRVVKMELDTGPAVSVLPYLQRAL